MKLGKLYGVSVGTGDPELITVKGLRILQNSHVIAFPAGINNRPGIAQNIIQSWLQPQQKLLPLDFPYIQDEAKLRLAWTKAAREVWCYLEQGIDVSFACLGDVSFYSTFTYLAQALQRLSSAINIETVPGVCSPMAIASSLNIPLTLHQQRLAVLPALYSVPELEVVLSWADVIVLLKVSSVYQQVWKILQQKKLLDSSFIVEKASFPEQKIYRHLRAYPQLDLSYFSIMLISKTENIHQRDIGYHP
ncbi:MAG: precorrin-2 C(20)-methyltransferase [Cyanobacteria bacterium P01_E01_bin.35]